MALLESAQRPVHVTISGSMLGGGEQWQTGFYMGFADKDANVPTQAFADVVRTEWAKFWTTVNSGISSTYKFEAVKCVRLEKNGLYGNSDVVQSFPTPAVAGGAGALQHPPQVALVATLIGGSGKGLGGKGRMYLPGVNIQIDSTGHLPAGTATPIATNLAAFFNAIDASVDAPGHVINVSRGTRKLMGWGARNVKVNGVRVGNVYDTQRRRRNALAESYAAAVVND